MKSYLESVLVYGLSHDDGVKSINIITLWEVITLVYITDAILY